VSGWTPVSLSLPKKKRTAGAWNDGALPLMKLGLELTTAAPPSFVAEISSVSYHPIFIG